MSPVLIVIGIQFPVISKSGNPRIKYNFNPNWKLFVGDSKGVEKPEFNDTQWKSICLPHAFNEDDAFRVPIDKLSTGIVWCRKHFKIPGKQLGQEIFF